MALLVALLFAGPLSIALPPKAEADVASRTAARMPEGRHSSAVASTGRYVYIFGGFKGGWTGDILRFDPQTNEVKLLDTSLPIALRGAGAAFDGTNIYVFGGQKLLDRDNRQVEPSDRIMRFDPRTEQITLLDERLPLISVSPTTAVWVDRRFFIFADRIISFDPSTRESKVMESKLPRSAVAGGFFDGRYIYIVTGWTFGDSKPSNNPIARFDPLNDTITTMVSTVRIAPGATTAWDGHDAYIFGGKADGDDFYTFRDEIVRFNPASDTVTVMSAKLPRPRTLARSVFSNGTFYIVGGFGDAELVGGFADAEFEMMPFPGWLYRTLAGQGTINEIVAFQPTPGPAQTLEARLLLGSVGLEWTQPASNTYGWPISSYRIYRKTLNNPGQMIAEVSGTDRSFIDACPLGKVCTYSVSAVNNSGEGQRSKEVSVIGTS